MRPLPLAQAYRRIVTGCILLVRHGETIWNLERRVQGRLDSPLTKRGLAQAYAIGRLVRQLPNAGSAGIVASPLGRAVRTAKIIAEHLPKRPNPIIDERLREISAGSWDGLTFRDIELGCPGVFEGDGRYEWNFRAPGGETYEGFATRVDEWLREADDRRLTIAVTHGVVSRVVRGLYASLPRDIALTLPVPQDRVFLLSGGSIEEIVVPQ
jgi:broad specificity phosphatase PhoE